MFRGGSYSSNSDSQVASKPTTLLLEAERHRQQEKQESPGSPAENPATVPGVRYRRPGRQPALMTGPDTKILVVWLESFEDHDNFPVGMFTYSLSSCYLF